MPTERKVVAEGPNFRRYSDNTLLLKDLRASYPHVITPYGGTDKDGKPIEPAFSIMGLMPKTTHLAAKNACKKITDELLLANKITRLKDDLKFCRDGNLAQKDECDGQYTVSAREVAAKPPRIRGPSGAVWGAEKEQLFYGGCYVNILIRPWFQSNKWGKRVNAGLVAVQWLRHGEPFGEGRVSDEDVDETFENEGEDEGAEGGSSGYNVDDL